MWDYQKQSKETLVFYMKYLFKKNGLEWSNDNKSEVEGIIDDFESHIDEKLKKYDELESTVIKLEQRIKNQAMALSMVLDLVNDGDLGKAIQKASKKQEERMIK